MYRPGKILRAGGGDPAHARAPVVDMTAASPAWREIAPMSFPRRRMNLTILADGTVMAMGGTGQARQRRCRGPFGARSGTRPPRPGRRSPRWARRGCTTPRRCCSPTAASSSAGARRPAACARRSIRRRTCSRVRDRRSRAHPATAAYGSTFAISSPDAADITSVSLMRRQPRPMRFDMNQRYVPLAFSPSGSTLTATAPASGGVAPPGDYMLDGQERGRRPVGGVVDPHRDGRHPAAGLGRRDRDGRRDRRRRSRARRSRRRAAPRRPMQRASTRWPTCRRARRR